MNWESMWKDEFERCFEIPLQYKEGKAFPLQAWTFREGSNRLRLPDFKIVGT